MATPAYPAQVRSFVAKVDESDIVFADHVNLLQAEVNAIQTELGTDPAGAFTTVKDFLNDLNSVKYQSGSTIKAASGTVSEPGLGFSSEAGLGFMRSGTKQLDLVVDSIKTFRFSRVESGGEVYDILEGGEFNEKIQFRHTADAIDILTSNVTRATFDTNGLTATTVNTSGDYRVDGTVVIDAGRRVRAQDGSAGAPAFSFANDTDTGMFRIGANNLGFAVKGNIELNLSETNLYAGVRFRGPDGSRSNPTYSFGSQTNTGMYTASTNLHFAVEGVDIVRSSETDWVFEVPQVLIQNGSAGAPGLAFETDQTTGLIRRTAGSGGMQLVGGGNEVAIVAGDGSSLSPSSNGNIKLGTSGLRWEQLYASTSTISTSDERDKTDIIESDLGLEWVLNVTPRRYRKKDGVRPHYGFVAQEVKQTMDDLGVFDFAGFIDAAKDEDDLDAPEGYIPLMGLRYEEFVAPAYKAIQDLHGIVEEDRDLLDAALQRIKELERKVNA